MLGPRIFSTENRSQKDMAIKTYIVDALRLQVTSSPDNLNNLSNRIVQYVKDSYPEYNARAKVTDWYSDPRNDTLKGKDVWVKVYYKEKEEEEGKGELVTHQRVRFGIREPK